MQKAIEEVVDIEFLDKLSELEKKLADGSISERFILIETK